MPKKYLSHLFTAARSVLVSPRNVELIHWIGTGPSIRSRARLALIAAFLVAAPTLFVGVLRTDGVVRYAQVLNVNSLFQKQVSDARYKLEKVHSAIWRYEAQPETENERLLLFAINDLREVLFQVTKAKPKVLFSASVGRLSNLSAKLESSIVRGLKNANEDQNKLSKTNMTFAMLSLASLRIEISHIENQVLEIIKPAQFIIIDALSKVGRDQLILFLVLLFAMPIFVGFTPSWLIAPLIRLKSMERKIEQGRVRDLGISGRDEISQLARAIQGALIWREELDQRKSAKIFEIRNVLRSVINHVAEPVLIIDKAGRINYANEAAATLLDVEIHHLEGCGLPEHVFAPELEQALLKAKNGDVREKGLRVVLEMSSGRVETVMANLSAVHERQGGISRVVLVLEKLIAIDDEEL